MFPPNLFLRPSRALALASAVLALGLAAAPPALAHDGHICWVQSVRLAPDGVDIRFTEPRPVDATRVAVKFGVHTATVEALHGHDGDLFFTRSLPETTCVMQVVAHGAKTG